jgi:hypothetical protein
MQRGMHAFPAIPQAWAERSNQHGCMTVTRRVPGKETGRLPISTGKRGTVIVFDRASATALFG